MTFFNSKASLTTTVFRIRILLLSFTLNLTVLLEFSVAEDNSVACYFHPLVHSLQKVRPPGTNLLKSRNSPSAMHSFTLGCLRLLWLTVWSWSGETEVVSTQCCYISLQYYFNSHLQLLLYKDLPQQYTR